MIPCPWQAPLDPVVGLEAIVPVTSPLPRVTFGAARVSESPMHMMGISASHFLPGLPVPASLIALIINAGSAPATEGVGS